MFKFTAEFKTLEELQDFIAAAQRPMPNNSVEPEPEEKPVKKTKPRAAKKEEPAAEEEIDAPRPSKAKDEAPAGKLTYESHIRPVGLELVKQVGRQALLDCFDKFGVANGTELTEDQFQPFLDEIKAALAKGKK